MSYRYDWRETTGRYRGHGVSDADLRVSDAERHEVGDRLSRHFADGRLDQSEFDARLGRATNAVTRGDLQGLFDDLPALPDEVTPPRRRRLIPLLIAVALVALALESAVSMVRVPWLVFLVVGVFLWHRFAGSGRDRHSAPGLPR